MTDMKKQEQSIKMKAMTDDVVSKFSKVCEMLRDKKLTMKKPVKVIRMNTA